MLELGQQLQVDSFDFFLKNPSNMCMPKRAEMYYCLVFTALRELYSSA